MTVQRLENLDVAARAVTTLGLDGASFDLFSVEGLSASLRRAASFLCPASPRRIVDTVFSALSPLHKELERDFVAETLDALVALGDLLELRQAGEQTRLIFLGPPSFVEKRPGEYLLLGVRPHAAALTEPSSSAFEVIYHGHTRSVEIGTGGPATLLAAGLRLLSKEQWTRSPRLEAAADVVAQTREKLQAEDAAPGPISGLTIIDASKSVLFYKGRWREPTEEDYGIFTGRRPQAYGAPLWCVIEMVDGMPMAVLDLPVDSRFAPGWDDARRIQAAIDAANGNPQVYRLRKHTLLTGVTIIDFFLPLPSWAERYIAISGWPAERGPRSLLAYSLPHQTVGDVQRFLSSSLWMTAITEDQEA